MALLSFNHYQSKNYNVIIMDEITMIFLKTTVNEEPITAWGFFNGLIGFEKLNIRQQNSF